MSKPDVTLSRWADTGAANVVDAPSGARDRGWVAGDPADDGIMNALQLQYYRWLQYLDAGDLEGRVGITSAITPAALAAGNTDNYNPTGLSTATVLRLTPDIGSASYLRGLAGGTAGRVIVIVNLESVAPLTLKHNDSGSTAANRFLLAGGSDLAIGGNGCVTLWYDGTSSRWRVSGANA